MARGITQSLFPEFETFSGTVLLGIAIHMALAIIFSIAALIFVRSILPKSTPTLLAVNGGLIASFGLGN